MERLLKKQVFEQAEKAWDKNKSKAGVKTGNPAATEAAPMDPTVPPPPPPTGEAAPKKGGLLGKVSEKLANPATQAKLEKAGKGLLKKKMMQRHWRTERRFAEAVMISTGWTNGRYVGRGVRDARRPEVTDSSWGER